MDKWGSCEEFSLMKVWQFKQQNKNIIILWKAIRTHSHENTWGSSCRGGIRGAGEGRSHRQDPCHRSADLEQWKVLAGTELATASSCGPCGWGLAGLPGPAPQLEAPWGFSQVRCHLWTLRHLLPEVLGGLWTKGLGLNLVRQGEIRGVWLDLWVCMYSWSLLSAGSIFEDLVTH